MRFKIFKENLKLDSVFFTVDVKVTTTITVEDYIKQIIFRIGFTKENYGERFYYYSINSFGDIRMFKEKVIIGLSTDFARSTRSNGMIRTKSMKVLLHRVKYFILYQGILPSLT